MRLGANVELPSITKLLSEKKGNIHVDTHQHMWWAYGPFGPKVDTSLNITFFELYNLPIRLMEQDVILFPGVWASDQDQCLIIFRRPEYWSYSKVTGSYGVGWVSISHNCMFSYIAVLFNRSALSCINSVVNL